VIFQLVDDHSRLAVASHVATAETAAGALAVFRKGVAACGVPQRLLSDNGMALNPSRRGWVGQLAAHAAFLGVEAITGKPYHPQTQGKNERFHQPPKRRLTNIEASLNCEEPQWTTTAQRPTTLKNQHPRANSGERKMPRVKNTLNHLSGPDVSRNDRPDSDEPNQIDPIVSTLKTHKTPASP
jgi:transposase InsO family protein